MTLRTPIFARPIELSMPEGVSTIRPGAFPERGSIERDFVMIPPRRLASTRSLHSSPYPNVPEAARTGLLNEHVPISTRMSVILTKPHFFRVKHRPLLADQSVLPLIARQLDRATLAEADPASHGTLERDFARDVKFLRELRQRS